MQVPNQDTIKLVIPRFDIKPLVEPVKQLQTLINASDPHIDEIARVINQQEGLSNAILTVVNSPFYQNKEPLEDVATIANKLGLNTLFGFCSAALFTQQYANSNNDLVKALCSDSVDIANAMLFISKKTKSDIPSSILYTIGAFHNCGMFLLAQKYDDYEAVLKEAMLNRDNSVRLEQQHYGIEHPTLAYITAALWNIPANMCQLILHHHDISYFDYASHSHHQITFSILKASEQLMTQAKHEMPSPDWPEFKRTSLLMLGISEGDIEELYDEYQGIYQRIRDDESK